MAKVHEIGIGAETRAFEDGMKRSGDAVEQAAHALDRLADSAGDAGAASGKAGGSVDSFADKLAQAARKAGKSDDEIRDALKQMNVSSDDARRAVDKLGDQFEDTGREGERSVDKLEDALRDAQRQAKRTEDAVDDIGEGGRRGFGKMGEAAQEVTQEVGQNLGEAVSSIRGDLSDLGQVGQDTLGGLAATMAGSGPAGILGAAALAAGAVGLGAVTAEIQKQNEKTQELKQYFADAWKAAVEGGRDYIDTATIVAEMNSIIFDPARAEEYKQIQADANTLGLDTSVLLTAAAGDEGALNEVRSRSTALLQEQQAALDELGEVRTKGVSRAHTEAESELHDVRELNNRWAERGQIYEDNQAKAATSAASEQAYLRSLIQGASTASEEVDELGNRMYTLPDGKQILIEAKTGQATADVSAFKGDVDGKIDQLNGRDVVIKATVDASGITREVDRVIAQNGGKTIKIGTKIVSPTGSYDQ